MLKFCTAVTVRLLTGFGQIMLQENAWTGLFFLVGIACCSRTMLVGALLGAIASTSCAIALKLASPTERKQGLYGFNGALVGILATFSYAISASAIILLVLGGALSSLILRGMILTGRVPPYTAPFIIASWGLLLAAAPCGLEPHASRLSEPAGELAALARGVGQVMFQGHWLAGCVFLAGIAIASRRAAVWAILGSGMGYLLARGFDFPFEQAQAGLFGFNAALAAIALNVKFPPDATRPFAGIVLSVPLTYSFQLAGLPPLTAPFVLSVWLVILVEWLVTNRFKTDGPIDA